VPDVAVIIPTLNEEDNVARAVTSAIEAAAAEVIVVDGGSRDRTIEEARRAGAKTLGPVSPRAEQLNAGAAEAKAGILLFLHADTTLPPGACRAVSEALSAPGAVFGGFSLSFAEEDFGLRIGAALINLRTRITAAPWGDQAQFVTREEFDRAGGFTSGMPILEDYEFAQRMRRRGKVILLKAKVRTSGRRFRKLGIIRTVLTNWSIIAAYHRGVPADELAERYRGTSV
jgi:rSAM/selenodomain-associated transferase 2